MKFSWNFKKVKSVLQTKFSGSRESEIESNFSTEIEFRYLQTGSARQRNGEL